jgi:NTE family protein
VIRPRFVGSENVPDEIWVIQINPKACKTVPSTPSEIIDRRNQMVGNISLFQSLEFVEIINIFLKEKALAEKVLNKIGVSKRDPIEVRFIQISEALQDSLDYVSKLSRDPSHIKRLIEDGEKQGLAFLERLGI